MKRYTQDSVCIFLGLIRYIAFMKLMLTAN